MSRPNGELHRDRAKRGCDCYGCERARWRIGQAQAMAEAVRVAKIDGERQARRAHELGRAHPGERLGAGELVDMLLRERNGG